MGAFVDAASGRAAAPDRTSAPPVSSGRTSTPRRFVSGGPRVDTWEAAAHALLLAGVLALLLGAAAPVLAVVASFPVLALAALRLPVVGVVLELVILSVGVAVVFLRGTGSAATTAPALTGREASVYLAACVLTALPLSLALRHRRQALDSAQTGERLFRHGFDASLLGMLIVQLSDDGLVVERANPGARQLLQGGGPATTAAEQLRHPPLVLANVLAAEDVAALHAACTDMSRGDRESWTAELRVARGNALTWVEATASPVDPEVGATPSQRGGGGALAVRPTHFTVQLLDSTVRHQVDQHLTELTLHDPVTGLPNRRLLSDRLQQLLRKAARDGGLVGLVLVRLGNMHRPSDPPGRTAGDAVLAQVAQRMVRSVRPGDTVARAGGDEFMVLCPALVDVEAASVVAERLSRALEPLIEVEGLVYSADATVGVAVGDGGSSADTMLREAEAAMDAAGAKGHRRVSLLVDEHRWRAERTVQLERALHDALRNDELLLYVQPIVDLSNGRIVAGETLVRWQHPTRGLLLPGEWLDVAEQSSLVHELGSWVLRESCRLATVWGQTLGETAPAVHVNVSPRQLEERGNLCQVVSGLLDELALPGNRLVLELTETYLESLDPPLIAQLEALTRRGVSFAADDFGTGGSPLTRVTDLPVDMLKIDRQFVAGLGHEPRAGAVVHAVLAIARALDLQVVAEGVETPAQAQALTELGCTFAQGYLWSPPRPPESFLTLLRAQRRQSPSVPTQPS